jgi:ribosomal protein S18 acetylase RimI-like enzyme
MLSRLGSQIPVTDKIVITRDAELCDARGIAKVHVRSWQAAYAGIVPDEDLARLSLGQREQFWTGILSKDERATLVLVDGHLVAGWSSFGPARDEDCDPTLFTELYGIYLLPEYWSTGCGKQLYRATETRIRRNSIENLVLWVFEKNTRARRFYEAIGYRLENGKQKEMHFVGTTAVQVGYRKPLKGQT